MRSDYLALSVEQLLSEHEAPPVVSARRRRRHVPIARAAAAPFIARRTEWRAPVRLATLDGALYAGGNHPATECRAEDTGWWAHDPNEARRSPPIEIASTTCCCCSCKRRSN